MIDDDTPDPKRLATLIAKLARRGFEVHELPKGGYMVHNWCRHRHCPDFAALVAFSRHSEETYL